MIKRKDILPDDYVVKEKFTNNLRKILKDNNFKFIMPPTCEHNSVYENTRYKDEIVKFMFSNELIILRPDFTPSIARMANTLKLTNGRIAYLGEVFRKEKNDIVELTQCGAEFIGDEEKDEDVLALLIDCFNKCDIETYSIDIGHSCVYRYIKKNLGLNQEASEELNKLICRKSINDVKRFCEDFDIKGNIKELIILICELYGGEDQLNKAIALIDDEKTKSDLEDFRATYREAIKKDTNIYIDLGIVKDFEYYTGIIFEAFIEGSSKIAASGGRYDDLISFDEENIKAIGFGINVDNLIKGSR